MTTSSLMQTYARSELSFERGEGVWLIAADGRRYMDCASGIAVSGLGHAHPKLVEALKAQAEKLWHVTNLYTIPEGETLAKLLTDNTFADVVFFCNSGTEAIEGAMKTARRYHFAKGNPERTRIITFENAFHGRTMAALAAGGQQKYLEGFGPAPEGFDQVPVGDLDAVKKLVGPETAAIMLEPVQGEGGVRTMDPAFLKGLREICDENGLLLIYDEIQTGVGRTGKLFAHEWAGVEPDIMAIAKGIGGGFPVGAFLSTSEAASGMAPGAHGTTFGGNPLAMAVGNAVLGVVLEPGFMEAVQEKGLLLKQKLACVVDEYSRVFELVRGEGLMLGLKCKVANTELLVHMRNNGLLPVGAGDNVLRIMPPMTITAEEIDVLVEKIEAAAADMENELKIEEIAK
ncbi:aspartate aminotransferase family protein [Pseudovibrio sp. Tun.PSC04-5.I4]|uniref:aspartate aminotransferase family protein n=1 Tax=Pseudovibrio sp. Tun.PSC04-5.I4 TaxID=1798213 RepID=UPI000890D053|nr:aspartate aminotransferase family protein [Pseudovibrio sp. Tun.PSC04-5.I4]SDQ83210.1 acetylornithine aminotransferase apoenzyme [Pseudovibrio sp. Tun.PSC04-5.I4]